MALKRRMPLAYSNWGDLMIDAFASNGRTLST
jgi:hypothetical protein